MALNANKKETETELVALVQCTLTEGEIMKRLHLLDALILRCDGTVSNDTALKMELHLCDAL
jgi:hypothetical protein